MSSIAEILKECRTSMDKAVESSRREFNSIRGGKASSSLLDTVRVEAYGQSMPMSQVASVSAPEPRLLAVTPWDKGLASAIEKAIRDSDLGLNPASQGGVIRVPVPALNEERRRDLVKVVSKLAEDGRIAVFEAGAKYKPLAESDLKEDVFASPAVADGRLYIRGASHLFCIGTKK